jgi:hypothetical protein
MTMCGRFGVCERSSDAGVEVPPRNVVRAGAARQTRESKHLVRAIQHYDGRNLASRRSIGFLPNGTVREDSEVGKKPRSTRHARVPGGIIARKPSAVQELLMDVSGVRMNSLVRLLGFTTLGCGCVTGHYREIATNREVTYVEEKGSTCNQNAHRRNHTVAPARFGTHALSAKAS